MQMPIRMHDLDMKYTLDQLSKDLKYLEPKKSKHNKAAAMRFKARQKKKKKY